jgi:hypothetical protein
MYEDLTAMKMSIVVVLGVTACSFVDSYKYLGRKHLFHFQGSIPLFRNVFNARRMLCPEDKGAVYIQGGP